MRGGRVETPALGPVGITVAVGVLVDDADGPVGIDGAVAVVLAEFKDGEGVVPLRDSTLLLVEISGIDGLDDSDGVCSVRESGRMCLSLPKDGLPPRMPYGAPRGAAVKPLGPAGGARFSGRACAEIEEGPLGATGAVKFLDGPLGGARNPAEGPRGGVLARGGDLGGFERAGDRSRGVDFAELKSLSLSLSLSRSLNASVFAGDFSRSRMGDRADGRDSRSLSCCARRALSGCTCGDDLRDVLVDVLGVDRPDLGGGEGLLRLQFEEFGPGLSSRRGGGLRDLSRKFLGGDLRGIGDLARGGARSRSNGDLDLLLNNSTSRFCGFPFRTNLSSLLGGDRARLSSSLLGGDLALLSSSLRGENLRAGDRVRGGERFRGGDRGLARQLSLMGDRSLRGGVRDLLRGGDRALSRPGCQLSITGGERGRRGGDLSRSRSGRNVLGGGAPRGRYDSPAPIFVTSPSPLSVFRLASDSAVYIPYRSLLEFQGRI